MEKVKEIKRFFGNEHEFNKNFRLRKNNYELANILIQTFKALKIYDPWNFLFDVAVHNFWSLLQLTDFFFYFAHSFGVNAELTRVDYYIAFHSLLEWNFVHEQKQFSELKSDIVTLINEAVYIDCRTLAWSMAHLWLLKIIAFELNFFEFHSHFLLDVLLDYWQ